MQKANIIFVLHSHLPWALSHGKWPHGEEWVHEAVAESYIPILDAIYSLKDHNIAANFTIGFSPVLLEQLADKTYKNKFIKYCEDKITLARKDEIRFLNWGEPQQKINLAIYWQNWYQDKIDKYSKYKEIINAFKELQEEGLIELMTCGATHLYYPLAPTDKSIDWQIKASKIIHKKHFGVEPQGTWIPECAYRPAYEWSSLLPIFPYNQKHYRKGTEELLNENQLSYTFVDEDLILEGEILESDFYKPIDIMSRYKLKSKYSMSGRAINIFGRHKDIAMQVWSGDTGYPGHGDYLDFHKKQDKSQLRYWRITDTKLDMQFKELYNSSWIYDKIDLQSHHFIHHLEETSKEYFTRTGKAATICLPFDTELFGHWWFEGPEFLKKMAEGIAHSPYIKLNKARNVVNDVSTNTFISIPEGSWGENNNHSVWMNDKVKWCWELLYNAENNFKNLIETLEIDKIKKFSKRKIEILNLILIELMLMQSSDWEFLINNGSAADYAEMRIVNHFSDFLRLINYFNKLNSNEKLNKYEINDIKLIGSRDTLFKELNILQYLNIE